MFVSTEGQNTMTSLIQGIMVDVSGSSEQKKFKRMYSRDRVAFVYDCMPELGKTLAFYQEEILSLYDEGYERVSVRGPHGLGKTALAAVLVHHAVLTSEVDCKVPTTASAWRQLEKYLWPEIHKQAKNIAWPITHRPPYDPRTEMLTQSIRLEKGTVEAFAVASDDHTTIEGAHGTRIVYIFDEAKTIPRNTWNAAEGAFSTAGLSSEHEALAFSISTPGPPVGQFYDIQMRKPGYDDWVVRHVTLDEAIRAGRISAQWAENRRKQWGEDSSLYQNRVLGEFADNTEEGIIPLSWVHKAVERWRVWDAAGRPPLSGMRTLGVDVARFGEDRTVIADRCAQAVINMHMFSKAPTTATAGNVKRLGHGKRIHIEMDGGLGAAVYDMLKEQSVPNLRPITVSAKTSFRDKSGEMQFLNVRAAMWWHMRELLEPQNGYNIMLPPVEELILDLVTPGWEIKKDATVVLEPKNSIKNKLGRSTDYADAVCLAFWTGSSGGGVVF